MSKSTQPKLGDIQHKLYRIWTNRADRDAYLSAGENKDDDVLKGVDVAGLKLYSSLIEIGRLDLMASIYPVIEELLGKQFKQLVLDYFEVMPPAHYNLNQSASRFSEYVAGCEKLISRYPFLAELADYEWIELAVMEDSAADNKFQSGDADIGSTDQAEGTAPDPERFAVTVPILNGAFVTRRYQYPIPRLVQEIQSGEKLPRRFKKEPSCVIAYRDPDSLDARFLEVGPVSLTMLETVQAKPSTTYGQLIQEACSANPKDVQAILTGCLEAIEQFKTFKLIVAEK